MRKFVVKWIEERNCSATIFAPSEEDATASVFDGDIEEGDIQISRSEINVTDAWEEFPDIEEDVLRDWK